MEKLLVQGQHVHRSSGERGLGSQMTDVSSLTSKYCNMYNYLVQFRGRCPRFSLNIPQLSEGGKAEKEIAMWNLVSQDKRTS